MNSSSVIPSEAERSRGIPWKCFSRAQRDVANSVGMTPTQTLAISLCLIFGIASAAFAQSDADFAKANQEFAQGHFKEAIAGYEALVGAGQWNANLFYDLGNAYFRTGDFGRAILNYERALALDNHHPEATANLH